MSLWYQSFMTEAEIAKVQEAVRQAELKTSGEIVPMVIGRSSTVGHVPLVLFLIFLMAYGVLGPFVLWDFFELDVNIMHLSALVLAYLLSRFLAGSYFFQRVLTPKSDQLKQVQARAELEFYESQIQDTKDATGVLLLVSLMERQAVILGDHAIDEKLPQGKWEEVIQSILQKIRQGRVSDGLITGVNLSGELLKEHFPIAPDDTNELSNKLIMKED